MKKMLFVVLMLVCGQAKAEDIITSTLLDHVMTVTQFKNAETKLALVDSIVQVGSLKGKSIFDLQAGFNSETKPDANDPSGINWIAGGFLKFSTLMSGNVKYPEHWKFLNSLEHGPTLMYDFREKEWFGSYQLGLSFKLSPL